MQAVRQKKKSIGIRRGYKKTKRNDVTNIAMKSDAKRRNGAKRQRMNLRDGRCTK